MRSILILCFNLLITSISFCQNQYDYVSDQGHLQKAYRLYEAYHYDSAYELFDEYLKNNKKFGNHNKTINAQLYKALSAHFSGKTNGTNQLLQFIETHPHQAIPSIAHLELGKHYLKEKEYEQALNHLSKIDKAQLNSKQKEEYQMTSGFIYLEQKKYKQAEKAFDNIATNPTSIHREDAIYYAALCKYEQQKYEEAWDQFSEIQHDSKYKEQASFYKASIVFGQNKYQEVIDFVENNPDIPSNESINQIIGQSYFNLERYDEALPYLKEHSTNQKLSAEAQYQLAYTMYQVGNYKQAVQEFEQLNIVDNEIGQYALFALGDSYTKLNDKEKAKNAFSRASKLSYNSNISEDASFQEAKLSYQLNRNDEAITLVNQFLQDYPASKHSAEANEILIDLFLTSNNYKDAYQLLSSMKHRTPRMEEAYQKVAYFRAVELFNNQNFSSAKPLFDEVINNPLDLRYTALANLWLSEMAYHYKRYKTSIDYAQLFIDTPVDKPAEYVSKAHYNIGYSHYNQKQYKQAIKSFSQVNSSSNYSDDAILRKADAYFALKDYSLAEQQYLQVQSMNDYAYFQVAMLKGLQNKPSEKKQRLQDIFTNQMNSAYADDALFEYAKMLMNSGDFVNADKKFNQLIINYPSSEKRSSAYNQLGFIDYNQQNLIDALKDYKYVAENYAQTEDAGTAMTAIRQIYIDMGKPDDYFKYIKSKNISISNTEQEQIVFQAAEIQFETGNCENASKAFTNYINKYPNGIYLANAYFYRGECNADQKQALTDYKKVIDLPQNKFTERSLLRIARNQLSESKFDEAIALFERLNKLSDNSESIYQNEIDISLMQAYHKKEDIITANEFAKKVLLQNPLDLVFEHEARYIVSKKLLEENKLDIAQEQLSILAEISRNEYGAKARYLLASIYYTNKLYQESIDACYRVADETPSHDDIVAKSFILIADNYTALGELFQAKATLDSVLENYSGDNQEIIIEATKKREDIVAKEKEASNIIED